MIVTELQSERSPVQTDHLVERCTVSDAADAGDSRQQVYVSLQHVHLPQLAAAGIVRYDRTTGVVSLADQWRSHVDQAVDELDSLR